MTSQLISKDQALRTQALEKLVREKKIEHFPLISAINQKRLYLYDQQLVTIGEPIAADRSDEYQVLKVYPDTKILRNNQGGVMAKKRAELTEVRFSRPARLILLPVLPYVNLVSPKLETRKLAFVQFQQNGNPEDLKILSDARDLENDNYMSRLATETILSIQLKSSKITEKVHSLVDQLVSNQGDNTAYILEQYLEQIPKSHPSYSYILTQKEDLEDRASRIALIQNAFSGVSLGSILIMIALGLSIIYGLAGVINMAHGEFMMIGAYTTFCVQEIFNSISPNSSGNLSFFLSLPLAFVVAGAFGLLIERLVLRKLYNRPLESLLATWGISLILIQLARSIFGDLTSVSTPFVLSGGWEVIPQLVLPYNRLFIIVMTIVLVALVYFFLYKSNNGLRIRAVTQNRDMSACLGISTAKIDAMTFFIGSGIAGMAGCCITLIGNVVPDMGQTYVVDSFLVVVSGGVGNLFGSVIAGLGIGQLTKALEPIFHAVYGKVIILIVIMIFLQFKPKGLFPAKGRISED
ncbi:urea ABC transporter permease subunit UrtB [Reichenbachiella versicolor]|uniref:urea ABC transporter permease subunit UrtB n=1 Tax=Reichenbachiella versicolor TaxID=1821036 RepID=UPI001C88775A|nr:urea ABC transporter permease subunit UrtB [Reichenbachiella versicolor]